MNDIQNKHQKIKSQWQALLSSNAQSFSQPLDNLLSAYKELGSYSPSSWDAVNVKFWLEHCVKLSKLSFSSLVISNLRYTLTIEHTEAAVLILQELLWCTDRYSENGTEEILKLNNSYPDNHWLKLFYCNVASSYECNNYDLQDLEIRFKDCLAHLNSLKQNAKAVCGYYVATGIALFYKYLRNQDIDSAKRIKLLMENNDIINSDHLYSNMMVDLNHAISQTQSLNNIQSSLKGEVELIAKEANKRGFEQLVIFTAIITFVITAAGSAIKSPIPLWEIVGLGMTLLVFVLSIMMCMDKPKNLLKDFRFYVLMAAFGLTAALSITSTMEKVTIISNNYQMEIPKEASGSYPVAQIKSYRK